MAGGELSETIRCRGRARFDRPTVKITLNLVDEGAHRFVATHTVLFERLHDDPIQIAGYGFAQLFGLNATLSRNARQAGTTAQAHAGLWRFDIFDQAKNLIICRYFELLVFQWRRTCEQLV